MVLGSDTQSTSTARHANGKAGRLVASRSAARMCQESARAQALLRRTCDAAAVEPGTEAGGSEVGGGRGRGELLLMHPAYHHHHGGRMPPIEPLPLSPSVTPPMTGSPPAATLICDLPAAEAATAVPAVHGAPVPDEHQAQAEAYKRKTMLAHKVLAMIQHGDLEQLACMLRCSKPDLNVFIDGQTALHYCLLFGRDVSWCKLLVLNGANPNLSNQDGWHPLHLAAFRGLKETMHYLTSCNGSQMQPEQHFSPGRPPSEPDTDASSTTM